MSRSHCHLSETLGFTKTLASKSLHSPDSISSHAHNLLIHLHASPPSSQPRSHMSDTEHNLSDAKLNNQASLLHNGVSPNHLSYHNRVFVPSPITFDTLSANQPLSLSPTPSLIFVISLHQEETLRPPTANFPASSPYLATNTLYHNPPLSTNNLHHNLPNKANNGPARSGPIFVWAKWAWAKKAQVYFWASFLGPTGLKMWASGPSH